MEVHVGKYMLENYVENLKKSQNATEAEENKKIKYEQFNKWVAYLLITNLEQYKYANLENVLASQ